MTLLGDCPGGQEFIGVLVQVIKDLSLLYAGTPDETARPHLEAYIDSIRPAVIDAVGAGTATALLGGLQRAVLSRKNEIEAGGASRS